RASAWRRPTRRRSSRSSTARRTRSCTRRRAAGSGSPSSSTSWRPTAAAWRWRARSAGAARSPSSCPWTAPGLPDPSPSSLGPRRPREGANRAMSKILIVEDEPDMVLGLKDNFEFEGYEVLTASDGQAGLERARAAKPDLLVLDIMLPKLSGLEVCKALR